MAVQAKQMLTGNFLMIACCVFYLLWWILAFKPESPLKGAKTGWLLIPAVVFGVGAIIEIVRGSSGVEMSSRLLPTGGILLVGLAAYVILLIVTQVAMKRQVTTELLLIVGWTVLVFLEVNAMYGMGNLSQTAAIAFFILLAVAAAIGLVCYLLYYNLDALPGYIDGMIPLLLFGGMMGVLSMILRITTNH